MAMHKRTDDAERNWYGDVQGQRCDDGKYTRELTRHDFVGGIDEVACGTLGLRRVYGVELVMEVRQSLEVLQRALQDRAPFGP